MQSKRYGRPLLLGAAILATLSMTACGGGGGGDDAPAKPTAKTITFYGAPRVGASVKSTAKAEVASGASATVETPSDAQQTVTDLQAALQAKGVPAQVSIGVMDGTTLHQIVMGENNGLPPTPDQFKAVPSEWMVVNFKLDDMVSDYSVPAQQAAVAQFQQDLTTWLQRAAVSGKRTFVVAPIPTCKDSQEAFSAAYNLSAAERGAINAANGNITGLLSRNDMPADWQTHMGADCLTPDDTLVAFQTDRIAADIAQRYALDQQGK